ncbi:MAG: hypothetical protein MZU97_17420 [Bacillus subtilis]|nr:hypothetical protein [Bacillus subtilis]
MSIVVAGAVLFGISDLILAPIYFKGEKSPLFIGAEPRNLLRRAIVACVFRCYSYRIEIV